MKDVHVHFLHGNPIGYNIDFFEGFIKVAQNAGLSEIYLLEKSIIFPFGFFYILTSYRKNVK